MSVSVVVCSLNGADTIGACLDALSRQTQTPEIVVVDDGSTDDTAAVAASYGCVVVRNERNRGLSVSRNIGWRRSSGEVVAFTDDDCVPDASWVEALSDAFERHPDRVGLGGPAGSEDDTSVVQRYLRAVNPLQPLETDLVDPRWQSRLLRYVRLNVAAPPPRAASRPVYSLVGANMSFRREALESSAGFDDRITFGGDEEDLCVRLRERYGETCLRFDESVRVQHRFEGTMSDVVRRSRSYGRGNARRVLKSGGLPPVMPFAVLSVLVVLASLARRAPVATLLALLLPLVLYARGGAGSPRWRDRASHPYISLVQEVATMVGFAEGWAAHRSEYRR